MEIITRYESNLTDYGTQPIMALIDSEYIVRNGRSLHRGKKRTERTSDRTYEQSERTSERNERTETTGKSLCRTFRQHVLHGIRNLTAFLRDILWLGL